MIAIIITIMVLELKVPHGATDLGALRPLAPAFLSYTLSFVYLGIYWNNHHHLLHAAHHVDGRILWANLHLLFWLSLFPFMTHWTGESSFAPVPVAVYGSVLLMAGFAYWLLVRALIARHGAESVLAKAIGRDVKGTLSLVIYVLAILVAVANTLASCALYVAVAVMWLVPDRRIERALAEDRD